MKTKLSLQGIDPKVLDEPSMEPVELSKEIKDNLARERASTFERIKARHAGRTTQVQDVPNGSPQS
jgi:hypothetical protein